MQADTDATPPLTSNLITSIAQLEELSCPGTRAIKVEARRRLVQTTNDSARDTASVDCPGPHGLMDYSLFRNLNWTSPY